MGRKCVFLPLFVAAISLAFLVLIVSSSAEYHRKPVDKVVKGKYIVVLENDGAHKTTARSFTDEFFSQAGRKGPPPTQVFQNVINGFAAELSDADLEMVQNKPGVKFVEEDSVVSVNCCPGMSWCEPPPADVPSWGLDRIDQRDLPLDDANPPIYQGDGAGVHIYVIDTGVSKTHDEFSGRLDNLGFDAFGEGIGLDCNGHGTHVAGTAAGATYGVAKQATVHSIRVLDCAGDGSLSGVLSGLEWIANNFQAPAVASMSLGGSSSAALDGCVEALIGKGIVVSVAAGNGYGSDACNLSPAGAPNAITVGATDRKDKRASFSNIGECVDIFAPGVDIKSAYIGSNGATYSDDGTSMACPHVSGAAAILLGNDDTLTPAEVTAKIIELSTKNKVTGSIGSSPNRLLYIGETGNDNGGGDSGGASQNIPDCEFQKARPGILCPVKK